MLRVIKFLLILHIPFFSFAQSKGTWKDGFVVLRNNDTLRGKITDVWEYTPDKIDFLAQGTQKTFYPKDVICFGINEHNRLFVTSVVTLEKRNTTKPYQSFDGKIATEQQLVFIERINDGAIKMYEYAHKYRKYFLVQENNGEIVGLDYYRYYVYNSNKVKFLQEKVNFRGKLDALLKADSTLKKEIAHLAYKEGRILGVIKKYHKQKKMPFKTLTSNNAKLGILLGAGFQVTRLKWVFPVGDNTSYVSRYKTSLLPSFGLVREIRMSPRAFRTYFRNEISFSGANQKSKTLIDNNYIKHRYLNLGAIIKRDIPVNKGTIFWGVGGGFGLNMAKQQRQYLWDRNVKPSLSRFSPNTPSNFKISNTLFLVLSVGARFEFFDVEFRFTKRDASPNNMYSENYGLVFTPWLRKSKSK